MEMPDVLSEFFEMRFRRVEVLMNRNYSLNGDMYLLLFAVDGQKTMAQLAASQQQMGHAVMMESIIKLWNMDLIEPIGVKHLLVDSDFPKLLKLNLFYIVRNKAFAYGCVDTALKNLGFSNEQLPVSSGSILVETVSKKISDSKIRENFQGFMKSLLLLRTKKNPIWTSMLTNQSSDVRNGSRGKTKQIIDRIIEVRSGGNPVIVKDIRVKLMLKGINPDAYSDNTLDNPQMLEKLHSLAASMGVGLVNKASSDDPTKESRGQVRRIILEVIEKRSKGNPVIAKSIRAKLFMKGINVDRFGQNTPDDPKVLEKVKKLVMNM